VSAWPIFSIELEARSPALNRWRHYEVQAGADLFGVWIVETRFGRIGTDGKCLRRQVSGEDAAREMVDNVLCRRRSAPGRIGVAYEIKAIQDPSGWLTEGKGLS
jgi:hypothetical protein